MFLLSTPELVMAQCQAGIVGCFPSLNARPQSQLRDWIQQIKSLYKTQPDAPPFGVNLVAIANNKRLDQDLQVCLDEQVPLIITSMQPPKDVAQAVHAYGGFHFHDVISKRHAEKAIEAGVDGLVLVCSGAGGHAGTLNPFAFVNEVRRIFNGTLLLAGCISTGRDILAAQVMGADLAYMGTRFIAAQEANAPEAYKAMIVNSETKDIIYTPQFTGVNANFLAPSIANCGLNPNKVSGPLVGKPNKLLLWWKHLQIKHIKQWKDLWSAGQGVTSIHDAPKVSDLIKTLISDYETAKTECCPC